MDDKTKINIKNLIRIHVDNKNSKKEKQDKVLLNKIQSNSLLIVSIRTIN